MATGSMLEMVQFPTTLAPGLQYGAVGNMLKGVKQVVGGGVWRQGCLDLAAALYDV